MSDDFVTAEADDGVERVDTTEEEWLSAEQMSWLTVACDLDDVVVKSYEAIIAFYNRRHKTHFSKEDFTSYLAWEVWGISRNAAIVEIREFYKTEEFRSLEPLDGAVNALRQLARSHHLHAVTGRPWSVEQETVWLIERYSLPFIRTYHTSAFTGEFARTKADVCAEIGASVIIEDYLGHAIECANRGMHVILFDQPWNQGPIICGGRIDRVHSWDEILKLLL